MPTTTLTSREFNQDTGRAKRATKRGPVFITDRGRPAHVLLSMDEYESLKKKHQSLGEMLAMDEADSVEFEPPAIGNEIPTPAEFD